MEWSPIWGEDEPAPGAGGTAAMTGAPARAALSAGMKTGWSHTVMNLLRPLLKSTRTMV